MPKYTNKIWTTDEDAYLKENYGNCDIDDLILIMSRTKDSILSRASILKVKKKTRKTNRVFELNDRYFSLIDSKAKAYWYGFLWADGSLYNNSFELSLQARDLYIIEKFKSDIGSTHKIFKHKKYNINRFLFSSKRFSEDLNKLNICNRKSYSDYIPIISDDYFLNFLLGLFDGDGHFSKSFVITCSPQVANWLQLNIMRLFEIESKIYSVKNSHVKRFTINKKKDISMLASLLYKANTFFLERKRIKFVEAGLLS